MTETKSESLRAAIVKAAVDRLAGYRLQQGIFGDTAAQLVADAIMPIIQASDLPPSEGGRGEWVSAAALAKIADDYHPDREADAPQALQEMRDALFELIAAAPAPTVSPMGSGDELWRRLRDHSVRDDDNFILLGRSGFNKALSTLKGEGQ